MNMVELTENKYGKTDLHLLSLGPDPLINLRGPLLMRPQEPEVGLEQVWVLALGLLQVDPTVFQTGSYSEVIQVKFSMSSML